MPFTKTVPSSSHELHESLAKLFKERAHVKSIRVNTDASVIEVDLDWAANMTQGDLAIPLLRNRLPEAKELVTRIYSLMMQGQAPTEAASRSLYELVDHSS